MTPEQREYLSKRTSDCIDCSDGSDIDALRALAAILTPEAEADRRLGAAVRELGPEAFDHAADAIDDDGSIFHDLRWVPKFRAIAAALREEVER